MSDKKFTPAEAAIAVLKKAEEMYKNSNLAKGDWGKIHGKLKREGYSEESADKIDGAIKAKMGKSEKPLEKKHVGFKADADLGEKVEQDVQQHEDPKHEMKGHIKLAKFMGRMEHKRSQKAKEMDKAEEDPSKMSGKTGMVRGTTDSNLNQKGVNQTGNNGRSGGMSEAGNMVRNSSHMMPKQAASAISDAKEQHRQTLGEMKAQPKPKLPG
jgi:hypothetical protein